MGQSPILSIIQTVTIAMMLNFRGGNNGHGLKNVAFKQALNRVINQTRELVPIMMVNSDAFALIT